ncbi:trace amine-associated receptor 13c-like [Betta splendens]|uniref:Trace amine-associated receptor 13c-like n=1 Tax=Betta splendens TaxID=158456 RepID=A0A6P7LGP7_BETSP|nr:trace amine-associated receptor 13c-like [Betta splendens]
MEATAGSSLCFPKLNSSCRRLLRPQSETALLYTLVAFVSLLTVALNLIVIFSISHFRQLRTPTNNLLLSLAVCDLLVGLLVMPVEGLRYIETCWLLGRLMCALSPYLFYCLISTSLGHMVLISIVRYLTICDPLQHYSKITMTNVNICIFVCWVSSIIYNGIFTMDHVGNPDRFSSCHGECVVVVNYISRTVDLFVSFVAPCTVMVVLYMKVFVVAVTQVRVIQSQSVSTNVEAASTARTSQRKAARTLGILVVVFLMCFCPFFYPTLAGVESSISMYCYSILSWITLLNSCLNPLIYALFYPWFRKAVKVIFMLRILQAHSRDVTVM